MPGPAIFARWDGCQCVSHRGGPQEYRLHTATCFLPGKVFNGAVNEEEIKIKIVLPLLERLGVHLSELQLGAGLN
jgi:hypothetical protein